ncbi:MFS transporter [Novosphingobium sp. 9U]|uniref:MFS transporter n=1 Tax=Novosphingobium sp. 9U TaxID=2653158 RepID=UPI0012F21ED3|nr:MFS transporter [Novosphingobium sp. 9U]VWX53624.1 conserved membrane hypothetical protein [Novosphingobium sp. 9U]
MTERKGAFAAAEWRDHGAMMPACFIGIMLIAVPSYVLGAMIHPLEQQFGWSRAQITAGPMIPALTAIFVAPLVGMEIDRRGPRRIALVGVPLFSAALALMALAGPGIAGWWALYGLLGLASMLIFPMVWTAGINRNFVRNRGLALAIALSGTGATAAVFPAITTALLESYGWRSAYLGIGLLCFALAFPLTWFLFKPGGSRGADAEAATTAERAERRAQLRSGGFLRLAAAAIVYSMALASLTSNSVPILLAEGFDAMTAATTAGTMGLGTITGRLAGGWLLDRFDGRYVAAGSVIAPCISALIFLATQGSHPGAMAACLVLGLAAGAEYDACAYLTARYFGVRNFGTLFGMIAALTVLAATTGPLLANLVFDSARSYDPVFWGLLPCFGLSAVLFLALGPYPDESATPT